MRELPWAEPLPDDVSNGEVDTSISGSFGTSGVTVNGMAGMPSPICSPRVPPYGRAALPLLSVVAPADAARPRGTDTEGEALWKELDEMDLWTPRLVVECVIGGLATVLEPPATMLS